MTSDSRDFSGSKFRQDHCTVTIVGSANFASNLGGSADLYTPIHPPPPPREGNAISETLDLNGIFDKFTFSRVYRQQVFLDNLPSHVYLLLLN